QQRIKKRVSIDTIQKSGQRIFIRHPRIPHINAFALYTIFMPCVLIFWQKNTIITCVNNQRGRAHVCQNKRIFITVLQAVAF
ncbi:MAG: hypothetical protein Q4E56_02310, partial [Pseudomonadota bacterium]|nr:hypothetical protein [Pseudomonadota bacterium]